MSAQRVFRIHDEQFAAAFALRPNIDRIEVTLNPPDLCVYYAGSDEPFPWTSLRSGRLKSELLAAWERLQADAPDAHVLDEIEQTAVDAVAELAARAALSTGVNNAEAAADRPAAAGGRAEPTAAELSGRINAVFDYLWRCQEQGRSTCDIDTVRQLLSDADNDSSPNTGKN